jgi:type I restriction enzyme S subunit
MSDQVAQALVRRFKSYPEYKQSGVDWLGEIPAHWRLQRLKTTVTDCRNGIWGQEPDGVHDVGCVRVADFDRVKLRVSASDLTVRSIPPRDAESHRLRQGDLLLEKSGGGEKQPVGVVVLNDRNAQAVCSNFIARLSVGNGFSPGFLVYLHASAYDARVNVRSIKQSTGIQNLDSASYLAECAAFPDTTEQIAITEFLDRETSKIDVLIAKKERLIELLEEKRAVFISKVVERGIDPNVSMRHSGVGWLGTMPAHWKIKPLKRVLSGPLANGLFKKRDCFGSGTRLINVSDIYSDDLTIDVAVLDRVAADRREIAAFDGRPGDVFFVRSSLKRDGVGASASLIAAAEPVVFECHLVRARPASKIVSGRYLIEYLNSFTVRHRLVAISETTTMTTVGQSELENLEIAIPPLDEQANALQLIATLRHRLSVVASGIRNAIDRLTELRMALITAAVTGRIDVRGDAA